MVPDPYSVPYLSPGRRNVMKLATIARQLSNLDANNPQKAGLITYPIGALYCAYEAQCCNFTDRIGDPGRWRIELNDALSAARDIAQLRRPSKSSWTRIVHFNSALMRIDVGFERLIKHITGSRSCRIDVLIPLARDCRVPAATLQWWKMVRRQEVNALKHHNPCALISERMKFSDMVKALKALVDLLESKL
jgi:hypothetical protein